MLIHVDYYTSVKYNMDNWQRKIFTDVFLRGKSYDSHRYKMMQTIESVNCNEKYYV